MDEITDADVRTLIDALRKVLKPQSIRNTLAILSRIYGEQPRAMGLTNPVSLRMARILGLPRPDTAPKCLACHAVDVPESQRAKTFANEGVSCESCHGPGAAHVKAAGAAGTILNPGKLPAGQINEFCGACHRKAPESGEETDWTNA